MKLFEFGPAGGAGGVGGGEVGADCGDLGGGLRLAAPAGDAAEVFTGRIRIHGMTGGVFLAGFFRQTLTVGLILRAARTVAITV
ncbi:MAG: hypothetical protein EBS90_13575, partial [Betaproteobacteria bacterium]|nr:hypothetical protein [Betaproteobacteria bacterium]